jgi:hypothetical protein
LGFEGIGIESGGIVGDIEVMEPIEIVEHEPGAKADGVPGVEVVIDAGGFFEELFFGGVEFSIMMEVMNSDLEATGGEPMAERIGTLIGTLGDKIERGAEAVKHFQFSELLDAIESALGFDIVGENEGKGVMVWPAGKMGWGPESGGIDGPEVMGRFGEGSGVETAEGATEA